MKKLIKQLDEIADHAYLPECKIKNMDNEQWWMQHLERYGIELLYEIITVGLRNGDFNWSDSHFMIDSETRTIKSFNTIEDIISWIGKDNLESMGVNLEEV